MDKRSPIPHGLTVGTISKTLRILDSQEMDATVKPWRVAVG